MSVGHHGNGGSFLASKQFAQPKAQLQMYAPGASKQVNSALQIGYDDVSLQECNAYVV